LLPGVFGLLMEGGVLLKAVLDNWKYVRGTGTFSTVVAMCSKNHQGTFRKFDNHDIKL
jgi:hypothetical protein